MNPTRIALTEEQVHEICRLMEQGVSNMEISEKYSVDPSTISNIRCCKSHTDITQDYKLETQLCGLSNEKIHRICELLEKGYTISDVAIMEDVSYCTISQIRSGRLYPEISEKYDILHQEKEFNELNTIHKICKMIEDGEKNIDIVRECGVPKHIVTEIKCRRIHREISNHYNFPDATKQRRRISDEKLHKACQLIDEGKSTNDIIKEVRISVSTIGRIRETDMYDDIACQYNFKKNTH